MARTSLIFSSSNVSLTRCASKTWTSVLRSSTTLSWWLCRRMISSSRMFLSCREEGIVTLLAHERFKLVFSLTSCQCLCESRNLLFRFSTSLRSLVIISPLGDPLDAGEAEEGAPEEDAADTLSRSCCCCCWCSCW